MIERFFVDTNVLLYRFGETEPEKRKLAREWTDALWRISAGRISWQVIFEFYANAARKTGAKSETARQAVNHLILWNPEAPSQTMIHRAWHWCDTAQTNYWDALILAAAEQSGCRWLLSEDFEDGRKFGAITIINPFRRAPEEFGLA